MTSSLARTLPVALALALALAASCTREAPAPAAPAVPVKEDRVVRGDVAANFDAATAADPRAEALCNALYDLPEQAKGKCCHFAAMTAAPLAKTCTGVMSAALKDENLVYDEKKAQACIAARAQQLQGCGWVTPSLPPSPPECAAIFAGTSDAGARCKSSLECKPGLRCSGASPLDPGRCAPAAKDGSRCGGSVDALAMIVDQPSIDAVHPECEHVCGHFRCMSPGAAGAACGADVECGAGLRCDDNKCVAGRLPLGAACSVGGCGDGARCILGQCSALHAEGDTCAADGDCAEGGCVKKPRDAQGVCGMRCTVL